MQIKLKTSVASGASQLGKLLRLATSTSLNNCYLLEESPKEM